MLVNLRIRAKLAVGFGAILALFVLLLVALGMATGRLVDGVRQIKEETLPFVVTVDAMDTRRSDVQQFLTDVSATHNPDGFRAAEASAAREQNMAGRGIAASIENVARMTEESSAATASVYDQASQLERLAAALKLSVAHFRVA